MLKRKNVKPPFCCRGAKLKAYFTHLCSEKINQVACFYFTNNAFYALMTTSISEYKTSAGRGGGDPCRDKCHLKPDTPVHEQRLEPSLSGLNMTTSAGVIVGLKDIIFPCLASQF